MTLRAEVTQPSVGLSLIAVGESLFQIVGAGGNVVALVHPDAVLLVDCGAAEHGDALLACLATQSKAPVQTLFNTHWHWDHTGANERFAAAGAKIIAHENTRLWMGTDIDVEWEHKVYPARPAAAWPTETFYTQAQLRFGDRQIDYGHLRQAHTDGDLYVFFRDANVLAVGDLLAVDRYPVLDYSTGGWIGGLLAASKTLLELSNEQTKIVPGTGPVQTRAALQAQHDMLATLKDRFWQLMRKGKSAADMVADGATREFDARWGNPELFVHNAYKGMIGHVRELGGVV